jgi:hypothetical protein
MNETAGRQGPTSTVPEPVMRASGARAHPLDALTIDYFRFIGCN